MVESRERLTPINEVWLRSERIRFNVHFPPWFDEEGIGIDLKRIERLINVGGINHVRVDVQKNKESLASLPIIVGVASDGSAYAGMVSTTKKVPTYEYHRYPEGKIAFFQNSAWTALQISLNLEEIRRKIEEERGSLKRVESWTPHLDEALRKSVRNAGTNHLLGGHTPFRLLSAVWVNIHDSLMDAADISLYEAISGRFNPHIPRAGELAFEMSLSFAIWTLVGAVTCGLERGKGRGYRLSLFPGYEIDRAILLQILSRTQRLIETIKK